MYMKSLFIPFYSTPPVDWFSDISGSGTGCGSGGWSTGSVDSSRGGIDGGSTDVNSSSTGGNSGGNSGSTLFLQGQMLRLRSVQKP